MMDPPRPLHHPGRGGFDRLPHAGQVDVDDVLPGLLVQVQRGREAGDARVGADDVDSAELAHPLGGDRGERGEVADVGLARDDAPVEGLHLLDGLREVRLGRAAVGHGGDVLAEVDRDDVGTFFGQPHRVGPALAPGGTGDERDLALHPSQVLSSRRA